MQFENRFVEDEAQIFYGIVGVYDMETNFLEQDLSLQKQA